MSLDRRKFLTVAGGMAALARAPDQREGGDGPPTDLRANDPWIEVDPAALRHNAGVLARRAGGRPIIAVAKNNAYGLGLETAGPILDRVPEIAGFAVVKAAEALRLRAARVIKPILLMGRPADSDLEPLIRAAVAVAVTGAGEVARIGAAARRLRRRATIHLYLDTGMSRMGFAPGEAPAVIEALGGTPGLVVAGVMTELTEDPEFDRLQCDRLREFTARLPPTLGRPVLHAASSDAVMDRRPEAYLDAIRPGFSLYGGYPTEAAMARGELECGFRLRARVVRTERLEAGEGVSYHRRWRAPAPTWIATIPLGHVDGYPAGAVNGGEVLIGSRLFRVIGTVSASHTVIDVGPEPVVRVGDVATVFGPDHVAVHPNTVAKRAGASEYEMFMHLSPLVPKMVLSGAR